MNRLKNTRGYLCGAMDFSGDFGVGWRIKVRGKMKDHGITWLDPTHKRMHEAMRGKEEVQQMREMMKAGLYQSVETAMEDIVFIDLRMVCVSDFIFVYIDKDIHHCGTYWELTVANSQMKPIIVVVKQGKQFAPTWLLGVMPHAMIFDSIEQGVAYLKHIAHNEFIEDHGRWLFFDFHGEKNGEAV